MNYVKIRNQLRDVYDDLAVYWGKDTTLWDWGLDDIEEFSKIVKDAGESKVLDLGCGSGVHAKHLFDEGLEVYGLDLSPKMINEAKRRVPKGKFVVGDMNSLPYKDEFFGGVYARASLLHIPKTRIAKVLKDVHRVLEPGGIFYLALKEGEGEEEKEDMRHGNKVKRFFAYFKEDEIKRYLENAKFEVLKVKKFSRTKNSTAWLLIFAEKL
ncbi:MAG: class I SAM-dependent methyltransferase [Candidatus Curtissbacteria bacterium]|nr:class I SAM-dependent methyltransferase [Candidatus Curtissbacteria bacterium]